MTLRALSAFGILLFGHAAAMGQLPGDALGSHSLGPGGTSPVQGARPDACSYCHAPHSGLNIGLWNQKLTTQVYTVYGSTTAKNTDTQPVIGSTSNQCLSCHDGTVGVGTTVVYGQVTTHGSMNAQDVFGSSLQSSHPVSLALPLKDAIHLVSTLASTGQTADPTHSVRLKNGNIECHTCHNPHVEARDTIARNFLVRDGSSGAICLSCHDPNRTSSGQVNPLADWATSAHATSTAKIALNAGLGAYPTMNTNACASCHASHNASGMSELLRGQNEQACNGCHNGVNVSAMPAYANVFSEYATGKVGHPFPSSTNQHDPAETALLQNNRHATCVDCHSGHGSQQVGVFPSPPQIRVSQKDVAGVSATDGTTVITPAVNQYENCLRCHGMSSGKQVQPMYGYFPVRAVSAGDPLNLIPQFAISSTSSHPVMHARSSPLLQPSLLANMLNLDGVTPGRAMGTQILCTDCHNSDDNREFGGAGANGPHGSKWSHILERQYQFSKAAVPGGMISNLFPTPDTSVNGPYAMCSKCHDLANQVLKNTSWTQHARHINDGFSCSVCHTAHGMGATSGTITGERLVNFDLNVVAPNGAKPIAYNRSTNSCTLTCHGHAHTGS